MDRQHQNDGERRNQARCFPKRIFDVFRPRREQKSPEDIFNTIVTLQHNILDAENMSDKRAIDSNWKIWNHMQEKGELDKYITQEIKDWRKDQSNKLVNLEEDMKKNMNENDVVTKLEELKIKHQKEEMQHILNEVRKHR